MLMFSLCWGGGCIVVLSISLSLSLSLSLSHTHIVLLLFTLLNGKALISSLIAGASWLVASSIRQTSWCGVSWPGHVWVVSATFTCWLIGPADVLSHCLVMCELSVPLSPVSWTEQLMRCLNAWSGVSCHCCFYLVTGQTSWCAVSLPGHVWVVSATFTW